MMFVVIRISSSAVCKSGSIKTRQKVVTKPERLYTTFCIAVATFSTAVATFCIAVATFHTAVATFSTAV